MAAPESFGNGGTHTSANRPLARIAVFHLMFSAQPPPMHRLGRDPGKRRDTTCRRLSSSRAPR